MKYNFNSIELIGHLEAPFTYAEKNKHGTMYSSMMLIKRETGNVDRIPVSVSSHLIKDFDEESLAGKIRVEGFIFSRTRENRLVTTIRVREITAVDENTPDKNSVKISGQICKMPMFFMNETAVCKYMLSSKEENGPRTFVPVVALRNMAYISRDCFLNDRIRVKGKLRNNTITRRLEDGSMETREVYEIYINRLKKESN